MSSKLPSDIWDQFVGGDYGSFKKLFHGYYDGLYGYGLKLSNDHNLVKDTIQNLFITIWERRDDLDHIESPNVYLYVSLRREIFKKRKKRDRRREIAEEAEDDFHIHFGTEELMIKNELKKEQKEKLESALSQLSNKEKEVLYLHYYNGMSYSEIEEILSINRQSVRNYMYRAMETLRAVLDLGVLRLVISVLVLFLGLL